MNSQITAAGIPLSHFDRMAEAVRSLLEADTKLKAWAAGGIYRCETLASPDGIRVPALAVSAYSPRATQGIGNCSPFIVPIGIVFAWEEPVGFYRPEDPAIWSVWARMMQTLGKNSLLKVPLYSMTQLADKIENIPPMSEPQWSKRGNSIVLTALARIEYRVNLNIQTMERA